MKLTKKGVPDKRFRESKSLEVKEYSFWQKYGNLVVAGLLGLFAGMVLGQSLWRATHVNIVSPKPLSEVKIQEIKAAARPFCFDAIGCIRDVGEELGVANKDIMTMIRLAKCESGMNHQALNKNTNGTFDVGLLQINDVHGKRISRADRMDMEKNIRFAYKLFQEQHGFTAWSCYAKVK